MIVPPVVQAKHVTFRVEGRALLEDVSLTLVPGSLTVLLGPNGAGKTTLIRVLAGILRASSGNVFVGDATLNQLGRSAIARLCAYLPQQTAARFEMRVEDAVALGRYPHLRAWGRLSTADYSRISWALKRVGLSDFRHRTLPTLSGGERQRVFLARALAQEAPILILDEPTTALDISHQLELMGLLGDLHRDGHTILASTHDLRSALDFFPHALLLKEGRLVDQGKTKDVVFGDAFAATFGVHVYEGQGLRVSLAQSAPRPAML
jgi:ABC-type cobalamin/Fe3+-siderophores transport system ATPase subunit